ncbi:sodium:solute symporter family transporter [Luteolibacter sp. AS25]|uniref:sodium:solute symporter family transporter n=1 Tax=Luteolibacter sp. AS25 TaxID=3135776 RepID=UPI00398AE5C7
MKIEVISWVVFIAYGVWMFLISPRVRGADKEAQFFEGKGEDGKEVSLLFLCSSLLVSWIFAKSIQNAADLGQSLGLPGGMAYASYWLSFITAGYVLYSIRQSGFKSLHQFLGRKYGPTSIWLFSLILLFRLWNEIWSNTIVVGQYFGEIGSVGYYLGTWATTGVVLAYALKGGMRSSIITDTVQMGLFLIILFIIAAFILPQGDTSEMLSSGEWTLGGGVDLILVALIQIWSYPFHDPVLTDRAFITESRKMKRAFLIAGGVGFACILLFSLTGVFNRISGLGGNSTMTTARYFGLPILIAMNLIMMISATSTLDSTLTSTGKLVAVDLFPKLRINKILLARIALVCLAVLGNLMVHLDPSILSATTVSGTMVIGLTPVFLLHRWRRAGAVSYWVSVLSGAGFGLAYALDAVPLVIGNGKYGALLGANIMGVITSFVLFSLAAMLFPQKSDEV